MHTPETFWASLKPTPDGCLEHTGTRSMNGYGRIGFRYLSDKGPLYAHHVAWALTYDGLPDTTEYVIHHLCRNKLCCNPDHLELLTRDEHTRRHQGEGCQRHGLDDYHLQGDRRRCRICDKIRQRQRRRVLTSSR